MFHAKSIFFIILALVILLPSTVVLAENDGQSSQQASSQQSGQNLSAEEIKLRIGAGDPVAGKDKAMLCFGCHGEDGNSADPATPKLAGQYGIYIAKQVRNYLASTRTHMVMSSMAAAISDADLDDIAAYFASLPMMQGARPSGNKAGKELFENNELSRMVVRCNSCHGEAGKGLTADNPVYPVIGGQHKDYLLAQLINFRKGLRNNSAGGVMNITVHRLSDAELEALADYASGL